VTGGEKSTEGTKRFSGELSGEVEMGWEDGREGGMANVASDGRERGKRIL